MSNYFDNIVQSLSNSLTNKNITIDHPEQVVSAIDLLVSLNTVVVEARKTLSNVRITSLTRSKKYDDVGFFFETPRGSFGPYKSRLPTGTIDRLNLTEGEGWTIESEKREGLWHWTSALRESNETESDKDEEDIDFE